MLYLINLVELNAYHCISPCSVFCEGETMKKFSAMHSVQLVRAFNLFATEQLSCMDSTVMNMGAAAMFILYINS